LTSFTHDSAERGERGAICASLVRLAIQNSGADLEYLPDVLNWVGLNLYSCDAGMLLTHATLVGHVVFFIVVYVRESREEVYIDTLNIR